MQFIDNKAWKEEWKLWLRFWQLQGKLWAHVGKILLGWADATKTTLAKLMYRQRGRFSQTFVHASMALMAFLAIALSTEIEKLINSNGVRETYQSVLLASENSDTETLIPKPHQGEITEYRVEEGDTVSSIAQKFGVSIDTIIWENNLKNVDAIKPKQIIRILPVTGIRKTVKRGETVYSIAKTHGVDAQNIIDYPFNTFSNDETFALSAGQELIIPGGVKPRETIIDTQKYTAKQVAPPAPGVRGEGNFIWPTSGYISQKYYWYHQAVDIANPNNPPIVAAQKGTVVTAGWNGGGYGNYVIVDHGNGYRTLYAHMLNGSIKGAGIEVGMVVNQGQKLGTMGNTGRSTGTHLHFEIKGPKGNIDPLSVLK